MYVGFGLIVAGHVASIIAIFSSCQPLSKNWQIYPDPGRKSLPIRPTASTQVDIHLLTHDPGFCYPATAPSIVWTSFVSNVLSDVYLILIPIPLLWNSRLRFIEKALSTIVLGAGVFVLACVGVKTVFILTDDINGPEQAGAWGTREAFVAVVVTNLPMVFPLIKAMLRPLLGTWIASRGRSSGPYKTPGSGAVDFHVRTIGGGEPSSRTRKGGRANGNTRSTVRRNTVARRTRNTISDLSFADSEERIVTEEVKMEEMAIGMGMGGMNAQAVQVEIGVGSPGRDLEQGDPSNGTGGGQISSRTAGMTGIVVSSEIEVFEDRESAHHHRTAGAHEPW